MPSGLALAILVEEALGGQAPGFSTNAPAVLGELFTDDVHLTRRGTYFMSLVNFATLYARSPFGAWAPDEVSITQKQTLQTLAWRVVASNLANTSDPSPSECRSFMRDQFCKAFYTYRRQPAAEASCIAHFTALTSANPFYFDASTDRTYWLPPP